MLNKVDDYLDLWMPDLCQECPSGQPRLILGDIGYICYLASIIKDPFVRPQR